MEGAPAQYFALFVNHVMEDNDDILNNYDKFLDVLENVYRDHHILDELNLRQHPGTMIDYISKFRNLSGRVGWNEAALVARFKDGLSSEVKSLMVPQWHALRALSDTMTAAMFQHKNRARQTLPKPSTPTHPKRPKYTQAPTSKASSPSMDLDNVRTKRITPEEKQCYRANGLCMYCGGGDHLLEQPFVSKAMKRVYCFL